MPWPERLSINHVMALPKPLHEIFDAAARFGVGAIGLNMEHIDNYGFQNALKVVRAHPEVKLSIYAAAGYWASGYQANGRRANLQDNIQKLDEAVELGRPIVGITAGGLPEGSKDLVGARKRVVEGVAELVPFALERGLKLAFEPLNPVYGPDRGTWNMLGPALDMIEKINSPALGIFIDTYHCWWEHDLANLLIRARPNLFYVQLADWKPEFVQKNYRNRALPGDGSVDFDAFMDGIAGFDGWLDMEVPNEMFRSMTLEEVFRLTLESYEKVIAPRVSATSR